MRSAAGVLTGVWRSCGRYHCLYCKHVRCNEHARRYGIRLGRIPGGNIDGTIDGSEFGAFTFTFTVVRSRWDAGLRLQRLVSRIIKELPRPSFTYPGYKVRSFSVRQAHPKTGVLHVHCGLSAEGIGSMDAIESRLRIALAKNPIEGCDLKVFRSYGRETDTPYTWFNYCLRGECWKGDLRPGTRRVTFSGYPPLKMPRIPAQVFIPLTVSLHEPACANLSRPVRRLRAPQGGNTTYEPLGHYGLRRVLPCRLGIRPLVYSDA